MKHINLSSWKGSITDWVKLNYINGGLPTYYADLANTSGYSVKLENGVYKIIEPNENEITVPDTSGYKHTTFGKITWVYVADGGRKLFGAFSQPADATRPINNEDVADFIVPGYNTVSATDAWTLPTTDKDFAFNNQGNITFADFRYTTVEDMIAGIGDYDIFYK